VTFNDLERRNGRYFVLFQRIPVASGGEMYCSVCYFVSSIELPIVLFGLTTTKLNKLYYYHLIS